MEIICINKHLCKENVDCIYGQKNYKKKIYNGRRIELYNEVMNNCVVICQNPKKMKLIMVLE